MKADPSRIHSVQRRVYDTNLFSLLKGMRCGDLIKPVEYLAKQGDRFFALGGTHRSFAHYLVGVDVEYDADVNLNKWLTYFSESEFVHLSNMNIMPDHLFDSRNSDVYFAITYRQIPEFKRPVDWERIITETQVALGLTPDLTRFSHLKFTNS